MFFRVLFKVEYPTKGLKKGHPAGYHLLDDPDILKDLSCLFK